MLISFSEEKIFYVYIWYIINTGEVFYVGKGKDKRYKNITKRNKYFLNMHRSHNCDVKKIYENLTEKEAFDKEKEMIKWYRENTNYRLTNQTDGGEGISGYVYTQEQKELLSQKSKEMWNDEDFKNRMIELRHNEDGPYQSKEFKEKISKLVSGEKNPNYQNYWSEEQKNRMSELRKFNGKSKGKNNPRATKIICLENGEVFDYITLAQEKYNVKNESSFSIALAEDVRTAAGLHWKYFDKKLLDDEYRKNVFLDVLARSENKQSFICIEDKQIYLTKKELLKELKISKEKFNKLLYENNEVKIDNKTYISVKQYVNSPIYQ